MNKKDKEIVVKEEKNKKASGGIFKLMIMLFLLLLIAGSGYYVWKNFDFIKEQIMPQEDKTEKTLISPDWASLIEEKADKSSLYILQEKIMNLQTIVNELTLRQSKSSDIANLNQRVDNMQDLLIASVNGKADAQALLGLITRLDKVENELNRLSYLNNEGAIMLTATMMVKEKVMEGKDFSFEGKMLSELSNGNQKIAESLKTIENAANKKVATNVELYREFDKIYTGLNAKEEKELEQSWKDRLNSKLNELITINKTEEKEALSEQNKFMAAIRDLADNYQFAQIATLIEGADNEYLNKNASLQQWLEKVRMKQDVEVAIKEISAYCLVLMKINNLYRKE